MVLEEAFYEWQSSMREQKIEREATRAIAQLEHQKEQEKEDKIRRMLMLVNQSDEFFMVECFRAWALDARASKKEREQNLAIERAADQAQKEVNNHKVSKLLVQAGINDEFLLTQLFYQWKEITKDNHHERSFNERVAAAADRADEQRKKSLMTKMLMLTDQYDSK